MQPIILIFVCLVIGIVLRWSGRLPDTATKVLGGWVINVALPAAALRSVRTNSNCIPTGGLLRRRRGSAPCSRSS